MDLPDQNSPMVIVDKKKLERARRNPTQLSIASMASAANYGINNNRNMASAMMQIPRTETEVDMSNIKKRKSKSGKNKNKNKDGNKKQQQMTHGPQESIIDTLQNELHLPLQILDFSFDGTKPVAFHLNIQQRMEVTKVKAEGQAAALGVKQGSFFFMFFIYISFHFCSSNASILFIFFDFISFLFFNLNALFGNAFLYLSCFALFCFEMHFY